MQRTHWQRHDTCMTAGRGLAVLTAALMFAGGALAQPKGPRPAAASAPVAAQCERIQVLSIEISGSDAQSYCRLAAAERVKVEDFWGATWSEPIRIHVDRGYRISRALVPAHFGNRGFLEMPLNRVLARDGALLHEIVHIYAPNANRFLAEGLAVYLHWKLAANRAFPNYGNDLNALARSEASGVASLSALDAVRTPTPLESVLNERSAYILAGSFVGFLIEREGLQAFRRLYDGAGYDAAFGRPLAALEQEWRRALATR